jgi:hypothetical protein
MEVREVKGGIEVGVAAGKEEVFGGANPRIPQSGTGSAVFALCSEKRNERQCQQKVLV